jgi:hypothetical protein
MFIGVHLLIYSSSPEADLAFFRDVLEMPAVDAGEGWLIFALPPAEMGVHPAETPSFTRHAGQDLSSATVYLMCEDLQKTLDALAARQVQHTEVHEAEWGIATSIRLPGGGQLGLYEPHHPLAIKANAG